MERIKRQLEKISPIEWMGIVAAVLVGLAVVWAWLADFFTSEFAWTLIPISVVLISAVLFGANQILQIKERRKKPSATGVSEEELESTVSGWLLKTGYKINKSESDESFFTFTATDGSGRNISVTRFKDEPDRLCVHEGYIFTASQNDALEKLPANVYSEILEDLRIALASFDIDLTGGPNAEDAEATNFTLYDRIVFGFHFSEDDFFERLRYVRRATTVVSEYLRRALRISAAMTQEPDTEDSPSEEAELEHPETGKDCPGC